MDLAELRADFLQPSRAGAPGALPGPGGRARDPHPAPGRGRRAVAGRGSRPAAGCCARRWRATAGEGRAYAFVDLEHDLRDPQLEGAARARGCRRDPLLLRLPRRARRPGRARAAPGPHGRGERGELPKAAVRVRGSRDQRRLAEAFRELRGVEKILLGMGEYGSFSRILAGKLGSWLTYCSPAARKGRPAPGFAPASGGQLDPRTLVELYRFRRIGPDTRRVRRGRQPRGPQPLARICTTPASPPWGWTRSTCRSWPTSCPLSCGPPRRWACAACR